MWDKKAYKHAWYLANRDRIKQEKHETRDAMERDPYHPMHGTVTGYCLGCNCEDCRRAGKDYRARQYQKLNAEMRVDPNHKEHGKYRGYQSGCRCERCLAAYQAHREKYKEDKDG